MENKKRGRPRKVTIEELQDAFIPEKLEEKLPEGVTELSGNAIKPAGLAIDMEKYHEKPFPENWSTMGKIEKLKWLTANQ